MNAYLKLLKLNSSGKSRKVNSPVKSFHKEFSQCRLFTCTLPVLSKPVFIQFKSLKNTHKIQLYFF